VGTYHSKVPYILTIPKDRPIKAIYVKQASYNLGSKYKNLSREYENHDFVDLYASVDFIFLLFLQKIGRAHV